MDIDILKQKIAAALEPFPSVRFVYLHGSYAQGVYTEQSDVDIAIYFSPKTSFKTKMEVSGIIDALCQPKQADVALLSSNSDPFFIHQVTSNGVLLFVRNREEQIEIETQFELKYFDQDHFRKEMFEVAKVYLNNAG